jgi:hypothetical protein
MFYGPPNDLCDIFVRRAWQGISSNVRPDLEAERAGFAGSDIIALPEIEKGQRATTFKYGQGTEGMTASGNLTVESEVLRELNLR